MILTPWGRFWLLRLAVKVETSPVPGTRATPPSPSPEEKKRAPLVGAGGPGWPVTVPVTVIVELGEIAPATVAVVVEARPVAKTTGMVVVSAGLQQLL